MTLVCTYVGSEGRRRAFEVQVDGQKIAEQTLEIHPTELFDVEYKLPEALTRGKERITVKFLALPSSTAGSVYDVRVARLERKNSGFAVSSYEKKGGPRDKRLDPDDGRRNDLGRDPGPGAITHMWTTFRGGGRDLIIRIYWTGAAIRVSKPRSETFSA